MALRWPCSGSQGAFVGLIVGLLLGLVRLILDFIYTQPQCHQPDERPSVVKDVHYLYFSMILSTVTLITMSTVSWLTEPPPKEMVRLGLTLALRRLFAESGRGGTRTGCAGKPSVGLSGELDFRTQNKPSEPPAPLLLLSPGPTWAGSSLGFPLPYSH